MKDRATLQLHGAHRGGTEFTRRAAPLLLEVQDKLRSVDITDLNTGRADYLARRWCGQGFAAHASPLAELSEPGDGHIQVLAQESRLSAAHFVFLFCQFITPDPPLNREAEPPIVSAKCL